MPITPGIEAQILRYYHAERWRIGTIATQLHVHRDSVARVLAQAGLPALGDLCRPSAINPYLPFILETLEQFPHLRASRLYDMVRSRGYPGRPDHFRHLIARYRPRPKAEAYLRLRTLPGEQMQVDWGHFDHLEIGRARRPLMGFGHRVYKNYDPRCRIIKATAEEVFKVTGHNQLLDVALELERIALRDDYFISRKLYPNVDFYSGLIYRAMKLPASMFTVMFAVPRTCGWVAHWLELLSDSEQKISRPRQIYNGPEVRDYVPMGQR